MTSRIKVLAQRRAMLTTECALQRVTLISQTHRLKNIAGWIKSSNDLVERLKALPVWASALLVGLAIFIPKKSVLPMVKKGLLLLQIWRAFSSRATEQ
jgi:hypothetical protein